MVKKLILGSVVVYVVIAVLEFVFNTLLLSSAYQQTSNLWRPEAEVKTWLLFVVYAFIAFFFTLIFSKGYEGKGVIEGLRYGFYVGMLVALPFAYSGYAVMPLPYSLALQWFLYGLIEYLVAGAAVALVFGKKATVMPVPKS